MARRTYALSLSLLCVSRMGDGGCDPINTTGGFAIPRPRLWGRLGFWRADDAAFTGNLLLAKRCAAVADCRFLCVLGRV